MKKILLPIHGNIFPESVMEFINLLNQKTPVSLTGFFIPSVVRIENWAAYSEQSVGVLEDIPTSANMQRFNELCSNYNIHHTVRHGSIEGGIDQVIAESRFADVVFVNKASFYKESGETNTYDHLRKLMHEAECPVFVIPYQAYYPAQVIFNYDGSASSVFAIKQFTALFPEFTTLEAKLLYLSDKHDDIPNAKAMEAWGNVHYRNFSLLHTHTTEGKYLESSAGASKHVVVTGSYGRPAFSEWFNRSFSEELIKNDSVLLFSAHL